MPRIRSRAGRLVPSIAPVAKSPSTISDRRQRHLLCAGDSIEHGNLRDREGVGIPSCHPLIALSPINALTLSRKTRYSCPGTLGRPSVPRPSPRVLTLHLLNGPSSSRPRVAYSHLVHHHQRIIAGHPLLQEPTPERLIRPPTCTLSYAYAYLTSPCLNLTHLHLTPLAPRQAFLHRFAFQNDGVEGGCARFPSCSIYTFLPAFHTIFVSLLSTIPLYSFLGCSGIKSGCFCLALRLAFAFG